MTLATDWGIFVAHGEIWSETFAFGNGEKTVVDWKNDGGKNSATILRLGKDSLRK